VSCQRLAERLDSDRASTPGQAAIARCDLEARVSVSGDQNRQNDGGISCFVTAVCRGTRHRVHGVAKEDKVVSFDERTFFVARVPETLGRDTYG
jgi:hypothetical protein